MAKRKAANNANSANAKTRKSTRNETDSSNGITDNGDDVNPSTSAEPSGNAAILSALVNLQQSVDVLNNKQVSLETELQALKSVNVTPTTPNTVYTSGPSGAQLHQPNTDAANRPPPGLMTATPGTYTLQTALGVAPLSYQPQILLTPGMSRPPLSAVPDVELFLSLFGRPSFMAKT